MIVKFVQCFCQYVCMYVCVYVSVCMHVYTFVLRPNSPTHAVYYVLTL